MNQQIPWEEYLGTLLRRKLSILAVFVSGLVTAGWLAWAQVPTYEASAKLRVSSQRARIRVAPDGSASPAYDPINEATLTAEASLLRSVALVREVLEPYRHRARPPAPEPGLAQRIAGQVRSLAGYPLRLTRELYRKTHGIPKVSPFDMRVATNAARVKVNVIGKSNLIHVTYTDSNPEWAAEFVNKLLMRHVERHTRLNEQADTLQFFEEQRTRLTEKQQQAEQALAEFVDREGIDSVPERQLLLKNRMSQVETDLNAAEIQLVEATARADFLKKEVAATSASESAKPALAQSGGVPLIRSRILDLELQRSQLLSQFTPTSIKVRDIDNQLAEARRLLAAEEANPSGALAVPGTAGGNLFTDLALTEAQIVAVKARIDGLKQQAAEYRAEQVHLDSVSSEFAHLDQGAARAKAEYMNYVKAVDEAKLSHVLDDLGIVNVAMVERAEVPQVPLSSSQWRTVVLGAVFSLFAGVALAFLRDHLDPSVKSAAQAERLTGLPILVDISS